MANFDPEVTVKVPRLSSFDKSFKNILTTKVGVITPLVSKYVMPGAKGRLKIAVSASLPPLASDTFMRCDLKVEAFLVPYRLLYGGFEAWLVGASSRDTATAAWKKAELPVLRIGGTNSYTSDLSHMGPGSLADFLGLRIDPNATQPTSPSFYNIFPFLAYHRVYDDWYRNPKTTFPLFSPIVDSSTIDLVHLPYCTSSTIYPIDIQASFAGSGSNLYSLHHRNYGADYFNVARPGAQQGNPQSVTTVSNVFTIAALRQANSLQQFAERSQLPNSRMQDYVHAHFGADLSSGVAQRAILLGSASYPVYSKGVDAQSGVTATNNPFTSVGAQYGRAQASGMDFVCDFECNEPSQLMVMVTLVPEANYAHGIDHEFFLLNAAGAQVDLPDPLLENTGNEPIYADELVGRAQGSASGVPLTPSVFGYVPKNSYYKLPRNYVHGLLREGQSLESFVAQRVFSGTPQMNTSFQIIPTNALDNVTAVTADLSSYGCWIDSFIDLKVAEPLVESAMPSLQDPAYEHGKDVTVDRKTYL